MLRGLAVNLRARGYEVEAARTGEAALELAEQHPPNAVMLDLGLPGMSGFDVIQDFGMDRQPDHHLVRAVSQADKVGRSTSARTTTSPSRSGWTSSLWAASAPTAWVAPVFMVS